MVKTYRGVTYWKRDKVWYAAVKHTGRWLHIGQADTAEEAAKMWDCAVRLIRGPDANPNFREKPSLKLTLLVRKRLAELGVKIRDR